MGDAVRLRRQVRVWFLKPIAIARRLLALVALLTAGSIWADDVRQVQLQLREQEPGLFLVQWQVPKVINDPGDTDAVSEGRLCTKSFEKSWTTVTTNARDKEPRHRPARP